MASLNMHDFMGLLIILSVAVGMMAAGLDRHPTDKR